MKGLIIVALAVAPASAAGPVEPEYAAPPCVFYRLEPAPPIVPRVNTPRGNGHQQINRGVA